MNTVLFYIMFAILILYIYRAVTRLHTEKERAITFKQWLTLMISYKVFIFAICEFYA